MDTRRCVWSEGNVSTYGGLTNIHDDNVLLIGVEVLKYTFLMM